MGLRILVALLAASVTLSSYSQVTSKLSNGVGGAQANEYSRIARITPDGRYVVFHSLASNLVAGDTNNAEDVFLIDRVAGSIELISKSTTNQIGNSYSYHADISADGRFIVFGSGASNFDTENNGVDDIFLRDRQLGTTTRLTRSYDGGAANNHSFESVISGDGGTIAFRSYASNLVPADNGVADVFVFSRSTNTIEKVSVSSSEVSGEFTSGIPELNHDGRFVTFESPSGNLVPDDSNGATDVFLRDLVLGTTERVSVGSAEEQGNGASTVSSISADGRFVCFVSHASFSPSDGDAILDVYVRDRQLGTTTLVSLNEASQKANNQCWRARISPNGQVVMFQSDATNLVPGDTNGFMDIFVKDLVSGRVSRESISSTGQQGNAESGDNAINIDFDLSDTGQDLVFTSMASNLTSPDSNGFRDAFHRSYQLSPFSVSVNASNAVGGVQLTGTVTLRTPRPTQTLIRMTDDSPYVLMSNYCVVPANSQTGTFKIWTFGVSSATSATISGYENGVWRTATLTLTPPTFDVIWLTPTSVIGGHPTIGNVRIVGKAPSGGVAVNLWSSNSAVANLAGSVGISEATSTKTFPVSTFGVDNVTTVTIWASALAASRSASLQVRPASLSGIELSSTQVQGGQPVTASVALTGKSGPSGRNIMVSSSSPKIIVPPSFYFPPQKFSWTFVIQTQSVASTTTGTVTVTMLGVSRSATLTLNP